MKRKISHLESKKNHLKLIFSMMISVIGAGFVSGAEIYQFFTRFQELFFVGVIIFSVLIFLLTYKILMKNINFQNEFKMQNNNKKLFNFTILERFEIKNILTNVCYFLMASAMFSGLIHLLKNLFNHNFLFVYILALILIFLLTLKGFNWAFKLNFFTLLILLFCILIFVMEISFNFITINAFDFNICFNSLFFAVLYVFMNIIQIKPIVEECGGGLKSKRECLILSFVFSLFLTTLLCLLCFFLNSHQELLSDSMPFLKFFERKGGVLKVLFVVLLLLSLISSMMSSLLGLKNVAIKRVNDNFFVSFFVVLSSAIFGFLDFKIFVSIIYPLVAVINFVIFVFL